MLQAAKGKVLESQGAWRPVVFFFAALAYLWNDVHPHKMATAAEVNYTMLCPSFDVGDAMLEVLAAAFRWQGIEH